MNKSQKEVIKKALKDEQKQLQLLKQVYERAAKDCSKKIAELSARKDMENLQSIIYQKQYQEALLGQINATLDELQSNTFISVDEYLNKCYETGYTGAMYDIAKQGIPIISPIDQKQVLRAIQTDSALSQGLYNRLGEDTKDLKKHIRVQISRGIANGSTWNEVADELTHKMKSPFKKAKNNAMRIVRTEGHRIQMTSQIDACQQAKKKGADVVKQWDATLDGRTRSSHSSVDGEIRELDEEFSNGLMMPGDPNGAAAEVCNCRCVLLQRARWALDKAELDTLKERAEYFGLDKTDNFEEFKSKYLDISNSVIYNGTKEKNVRFNSIADPMADYYGAGLKSHPKEIEAFMKELEDCGAELVIKNHEIIAYQPSPTSGKPGQMVIYKGASYSAWCHEMQHLRDDKNAGWTGIRILTDVDEHYKREQKAYNVEIKLAEELGNKEAVEKIKANLEQERRLIYGQ